MRISDWSSRVLFRSCTCRGAEPGEAVAGLRECRIDLDRRGDRAGAGEGERDMIVIRLGLRRGIGVEAVALMGAGTRPDRSEEHPSALQSLMRIWYAVFCLKTQRQPTEPKSSSMRIQVHLR